MKKYGMLILTLIMILVTTAAYAYENYDIQVPEIRKPAVDMESQKFGSIKNIVWIDKYISDKPGLIILASKEGYSFLYYLDIESGEHKLLSQALEHKYLNDVILTDNPFSGKSIVTAYNDGIIKTKLVLSKETEVNIQNQEISIEGFNEASSMEVKGNVFYAKPKDKFIYIKPLNGDPFVNMFNNNPQPDITKFYRSPYNIVNASGLDGVLTYTSSGRNGLELYAMDYNGNPVSKLNKPLFKNVISAKGIEEGFGFAVMNMVENADKSKSLDVYMARRSYAGNKETYKLDTIPYNTDKFGAVPSIDIDTFNEQYSAVYTSYDKEGRGQLKISSYGENPKVIIENENIFGPVSIKRSPVSESNAAAILYFTYEGGRVKAKICDSNGKLIKDITEMIF